MKSKEAIGKILTDSIPREFILNFERHYPAALEKAQQIGDTVAEGHRNSVVGHHRHFALNEAVVHAFDDTGITHNPLRGNGIVFGRVNVATLGRVHMNYGKWDNSRRSKSKIKLCLPNKKIAAIVQYDFWSPVDTPIAEITAFLVTQGSGTAMSPATAYIVVPDDTMDLRNPIFLEPLSVFIQRYQQLESVVDSAVPRLKAGVKIMEHSDKS
ncbi:hypothetical protein ACFQ0F_08340 [Paraperlucidibaca wandonensis]|uniref:Uncharacterized protein n=1 Tax=Paraperlucidibaca wandonensis TaxID=1268273 RepID=A0ABW3HIF2_9GAMM